MRIIGSIFVLGILGACAPTVPDSGAGFSNTIEDQRARDAALTTGNPLIPPAVLSDEVTASGAATGVATGAPLAAPMAVPVRPAVVGAQPTVVARPLPGQVTGQASGAGSADDIAAATAAALASSGTRTTPNNAGLSDENDFAAVSARETIESDAARIARNRAQYEVVQPAPVPARPGDNQPNIVKYALSTNNPVGVRLYSRSGFNTAAKAARNCAKYASPDQAQMAFLAKGGPQKDRQGLDPDGDGYACSWDPAPFRQAVGN